MRIFGEMAKYKLIYLKGSNLNWIRTRYFLWLILLSSCFSVRVSFFLQKVEKK